MKAMITKGGIQNWINSRENQFIEQDFKSDELLEAENLNERERYIAQNLVTRGVLDKDVNEGKASYKLNINKMAR